MTPTSQRFDPRPAPRNRAPARSVEAHPLAPSLGRPDRFRQRSTSEAPLLLAQMVRLLRSRQPNVSPSRVRYADDVAATD